MLKDSMELYKVFVEQGRKSRESFSTYKRFDTCQRGNLKTFSILIMKNTEMILRYLLLFNSLLLN